MDYKVKNKILSRQISKAYQDDKLSIQKLLDLVEQTYEDFDRVSKLNYRTSKVLEEEIQEKESQVLRILNSKKELLRVLCHDFNNSISILNLAYSQAIRNQTDTKNIKLWEKVNKVCQIQNSMITHVREMEALETGKLQIALQPIRLSDIADNISFIFEAALKDKDINLNMETFNIQAKVLAEPSSVFNTVINNVVSNAIKFSRPKSEITVQSQALDKFTVISVSDEGIGIPKAILDSLFAMNKSTSRPGTKGEKGTGFGMPLVKKYMELFGGDIIVDSKCQEDFPQDSGTTIKLKFKSA